MVIAKAHHVKHKPVTPQAKQQTSEHDRAHADLMSSVKQAIAVAKDPLPSDERLIAEVLQKGQQLQGQLAFSAGDIQLFRELAGLTQDKLLKARLGQAIDGVIAQQVFDTINSVLRDQNQTLNILDSADAEAGKLTEESAKRVIKQLTGKLCKVNGKVDADLKQQVLDVVAEIAQGNKKSLTDGAFAYIDKVTQETRGPDPVAEAQAKMEQEAREALEKSQALVYKEFKRLADGLAAGGKKAAQAMQDIKQHAVQLSHSKAPALDKLVELRTALASAAPSKDKALNSARAQLASWLDKMAMAPIDSAVMRATQTQQPVLSADTVKAIEAALPGLTQDEQVKAFGLVERLATQLGIADEDTRQAIHELTGAPLDKIAAVAKKEDTVDPNAGEAAKATADAVGQDSAKNSAVNAKKNGDSVQDLKTKESAAATALSKKDAKETVDAALKAGNPEYLAMLDAAIQGNDNLKFDKDSQRLLSRGAAKELGEAYPDTRDYANAIRDASDPMKTHRPNPMAALIASGASFEDICIAFWIYMAEKSQDEILEAQEAVHHFREKGDAVKKAAEDGKLTAPEKAQLEQDLSELAGFDRKALAAEQASGKIGPQRARWLTQMSFGKLEPEQQKLIAADFAGFARRQPQLFDDAGRGQIEGWARQVLGEEAFKSAQQHVPAEAKGAFAKAMQRSTSYGAQAIGTLADLLKDPESAQQIAAGFGIDPKDPELLQKAAQKVGASADEVKHFVERQRKADAEEEGRRAGERADKRISDGMGFGRFRSQADAEMQLQAAMERLKKDQEMVSFMTRSFAQMMRTAVRNMAV